MVDDECYRLAIKDRLRKVDKNKKTTLTSQVETKIEKVKHINEEVLIKKKKKDQIKEGIELKQIKKEIKIEDYKSFYEKDKKCDACDYCDDICTSKSCKNCKIKKINLYKKYKNCKNNNIYKYLSQMKNIFWLNEKPQKNTIFINKKDDKENANNNENIKKNIDATNRNSVINSSSRKIVNNEKENNSYKALNDVSKKNSNCVYSGNTASNVVENEVGDEEKSLEYNFIKYKQYFTKCEIKKHCKINDCWIIANDYVYDVTSFITHHPGGVNCILKKSGNDATVDYFFHSKYAQKQIWDPLRIGQVVKCKRELLEEK